MGPTRTPPDRLKPRLNPVVDDGPPQAGAQARARDLQRANSDADQFGDFLAALAALDQILNLLDALGRELDLAATPAKLDDLKHFFFFSLCVQRLPCRRFKGNHFMPCLKH